jgi:hypothetical protein
MDNKSVQEYFSDKPIQQHLFDLIRQHIEPLGEVTTKVTKSQIAFANKRKFAWVWLPMKWDTRRPINSIILSFSLGKKIMNPKIVQVVEPYHKRFMHHVIIEKESDVSPDVKEWLIEAYIFGYLNTP